MDARVSAGIKDVEKAVSGGLKDVAKLFIDEDNTMIYLSMLMSSGTEQADIRKAAERQFNRLTAPLV